MPHTIVDETLLDKIPVLQLTVAWLQASASKPLKDRIVWVVGRGAPSGPFEGKYTDPHGVAV